MIHPLEKKRATYLTAFEEGVRDALHNSNVDDSKRSSAYYRRGYDFGLSLGLEEVIVGDEEEVNGDYYLKKRSD